MQRNPTLADIPLKTLSPGEPFQYRSGDLELDTLCKSIAAHGQVFPIVIRRTGARLEVVSGHRRVAALRKLKKRTVRAMVFEDLPENEAISTSLLENLERKGIDDADRVRTAVRLFRSGMPKSEIASAFNLSIRSIERLVALGKAPPEYMNALQRGEITVQQAYEACRRGVPVSEVISGKRSVKYLREVSQKRLLPRDRIKPINISLSYIPGVSSIQKLKARIDDYMRQVILAQEHAKASPGRISES